LAASEDTKSICLELQALPVNGATLKSNQDFAKDNLAVIVLKRFEVEADTFDGGCCAGPVPVFFSTDPEDTRNKLKASLKLAHQLCQAIATRFLSTETLTAAEARDLQGAPKEGKATSPFARALRETTLPIQKKQKTAPPAELTANSAADTAGTPKKFFVCLKKSRLRQLIFQLL
jgi:hypothetical protein